jgi:hypothetical protein
MTRPVRRQIRSKYDHGSPSTCNKNLTCMAEHKSASKTEHKWFRHCVEHITAAGHARDDKDRKERLFTRDEHELSA